MEKEVWKDIVGYEGLYEVSSLGKIRSVDMPLIHKSGKIYIRKGRLIAQNKNHNGYLRVNLWSHNVIKSYFVHRIVYTAFNGQIPEGMQINHINECKTDNRLSNLNLMTPKENTNWGTGIARGRKKVKRPVIQYLIDNTPFMMYFSAADAEYETKVQRTNIRKCCNGERLTAGGFKWRYA